jgi:collagen adhesin
MKNKIKYFLLTLLMFVMPLVSNAQSLDNIEINIPKNSKDEIEDGTYEVYDITDIYNSIEDKENKTHKDLSVELRDKSIKEIENIELVESINSVDGKVRLNLDKEKSYLIKEKNNYIIPVPIIGPTELSDTRVLEISPKLQNKFKLIVKKTVEGTDYSETPFNIVVDINGRKEEIQLKANEEKEFSLLPNDEYKIEEKNIPYGYSLKEITNDKGNISNSDITSIIKNEYKAKGKFDIEALKTLKNKELKDGEFTFELLDEDNKVIKTAKNDKDGVIRFEDISLDQIGEHTYKIREVDNGLNNIEYDKNIYEIKVLATDNNDGTLQITKQEDKEVNFVNTFIKEEVEYGNLRIEKTVIGKDTDEEFEITVKLYDEQGQELKGSFKAISNKKDSFNIKSGDTIKISHNEIITINKLPLNSKYKITEKEYKDYKLSENSIVEGEVKSITDSHLYNEYISPKLGKLILKKEVSGDGYDENQSFRFNVKIGDKEEVVELKNNEIKEFNDIPYGTYYNIEEIDIPEKYTLEKFENSSGVINNDTIYVKAINKYSQNTTATEWVKTGIPGISILGIIIIVVSFVYIKLNKETEKLSNI